jgi:hypothetical protein
MLLRVRAPPPPRQGRRAGARKPPRRGRRSGCAAGPRHRPPSRRLCSSWGVRDGESAEPLVCGLLLTTERRRMPACARVGEERRPPPAGDAGKGPRGHMSRRRRERGDPAAALLHCRGELRGRLARLLRDPPPRPLLLCHPPPRLAHAILCLRAGAGGGVIGVEDVGARISRGRAAAGVAALPPSPEPS